MEEAVFGVRKYNEALQDCKQALSIDKKLHQAWNNKGVAERWLGKHNEALKSFEHAIALNPNDAIGYDNKCSVLNTMRRYDEAKVFCTKAIDLDPNHAMAYSNIAFALCNLQRYDDAVLDCNEAIDLKQDLVNAWLNKGLALGLSAKYKDAVKLYDEMLAIFPHDSVCIPDVYYNKGYVLSKIADEENNALLCLNKAIELRPNYIMAYCSKGKLLRSMNNRDKEALECFNEALLCSKDDNLSTGNIAYIEQSINIDREELFTKLRQVHALLTQAKENIKDIDPQGQNTKPIIAELQALESAEIDIMSTLPDDIDGRQTPERGRQIKELVRNVELLQNEIERLTVHVHDQGQTILELKHTQDAQKSDLKGQGQDIADLRQDIDVVTGQVDSMLIGEQIIQ